MRPAQVELLHAVQWRDLRLLRGREVANELALSLPWLLASLFAAAWGYEVLALACSFMFFLAGLRQVHNAFHNALGLPRVASDWVMLVLSVLMLGSMHAVQINHLRHHRHCMADDDIEAMGARRSALGAVLLGPWFPWCLHRKAIEVATPVQRRWIFTELVANGAWIGVVFLLDLWPLQYHVLAMAAAQCLTAFFAVWTTHHDCPEDGPIARTNRSRFKAIVTYNMFYHFEHHMFPSVPTCKLAILAGRIDAEVPGLRMRYVW